LTSLFPKNPLKRIVFLASGRGSNFEAVAKKIRQKKISGLPVGLITDNPEARCRKIAGTYGIPAFLLDFRSFSSKDEYNTALLEKVNSLSPDLIVTAGYMRLLRKDFVETYRNRILNIHPSLLPAFPGVHAHRDAIAYGVKFSGCTVHFVDEGVDTGPIVLQSVVKIPDGMTESELARAVLKEEHKILPKAIDLFCNDRLSIEGRKVKIQS